MTPPCRIEDLGFLVGSWRGEGRLRGAAVTTRSVGSEFGGNMIRLDVETEREGAVVHKERILFGVRAAGVEATTSPWRGDAQRWTVEAAGPGRFVLTSPGLRWTIEQVGPGAYAEVFGRASAGGEFEGVVELVHRRVEERT
jgi:hypothetical protein